MSYGANDIASVSQSIERRTLICPIRQTGRSFRQMKALSADLIGRDNELKLMRNGERIWDGEAPRSDKLRTAQLYVPRSNLIVPFFRTRRRVVSQTFFSHASRLLPGYRRANSLNAG